MASTLPVVKSNASVLAPPPFLLLLFLLLLLSLFLALSLLDHINDLLTHSLSSPPLFHFLLFDKQGFDLSHLLHIQQHYQAFLLSPCSIFILANLIVFTLFLSVYFSSSSSSSSSFSDLSDFVPEKFEYGHASLPEHSLPSHEDFFLASPPHQQHSFLSHDPPEEYHVLSFNTNYDESTYYRNVQSYNKLSNNWEMIKGVNPYINSNGVIAQKELKKPADKVMLAEKAQTTLTVAAATPTYKMNVDQGKVVEKRLQEIRLEEKASRSTKAAFFPSPGSQAVVINMELAPASRRTRILTNTSMQASHPPLAPLCPSQHPTKAAPLPSNTSSMSAQRPPSSPRVKKNLQITGSFANDGRYEASKPTLDGEKQASKPISKPQKKQSSMVRSQSDQRLSQRDPSAEVTTVLTSPSFTSRPHMQRAQSLRSSSTISNVLTNKPHIIQRAQSLRDNGMLDIPNSHPQVTRSPSFSAALDGLSDSEANKCFSDFIAHRFALMKKELD